MPTYRLPQQPRPRTESGAGDDRLWLDQPLPRLPYRDVMALYPRDEQPDYAQQAAEAFNALFRQPVVRMPDAKQLRDPRLFKQWLFPDAVTQPQPPLYGAVYYNTQVSEPRPSLRDDAIATLGGTWTMRPMLQRGGR